VAGSYGKDERGIVLITSAQLIAKVICLRIPECLIPTGMGRDFHFAIDPWVVTSFSRHDTIPPRGYKDVYYGLRALRGANKVVLEARLRYRQADQGVAEAILGAVPGSINLKEVYGLTKVPTLPVVDMVVKQVSLDNYTK